MATGMPDDNPLLDPLADHLRLRHNRVGRWLQQQSTFQPDPGSGGGRRVTNGTPVIGTPCHPYLAFPELSHRGVPELDEETVESYDILDEEDADLEPSGPAPVSAQPALVIPEPPSRSLSPLIQRLSRAHVRSRSDLTSNRLHRHQHHHLPLSTSTSAKSPRLPDHDGPLDAASTRTNVTSWKFPRAARSVGMSSSHSLAHSTDMSTHSRSSYSRPSMSSDRTYTSQSSNTVNSAATTTAEKRSIFSTATLSRKTSRIFKSTSPSLFSLPVLTSAGPREELVLSNKQNPFRRPFSSVQTTPSNSSHIGGGVNLLSGRSRSKQKTLVIIGVAPNDGDKLEGVKRWCESFGEIRKITRTSSGELHVQFRLPEVADTVCRLRATVHIAGVGSISLSWFRGRNPI